MVQADHTMAWQGVLNRGSGSMEIKLKWTGLSSSPIICLLRCMGNITGAMMQLFQGRGVTAAEKNNPPAETGGVFFNCGRGQGLLLC